MSEQRVSQKPSIVAFIFFYTIIFLCWLFALIFYFTRWFGDTSLVLANYLVAGEFKSIGEVVPTWGLTVTDIIIKVNLFLVGTVSGTIFLIYNVLPKMKNLNAFLLVTTFIAAYIPSLLTIQNILSGVGGGWLGFLHNYMTLDRFLILLVLYPLNYAVFFYLYYLLNTFVFNKK